MNSAYSNVISLPKINSNIAIPFKMIFIFNVSDFWQYFYFFPELATCLERSIIFDLLKNAIVCIKFIKSLIIQFPLSSCYIILLTALFLNTLNRCSFLYRIIYFQLPTNGTFITNKYDLIVVIIIYFTVFELLTTLMFFGNKPAERSRNFFLKPLTPNDF
jgi:hypothetical protein